QPPDRSSVELQDLRPRHRANDKSPPGAQPPARLQFATFYVRKTNMRWSQYFINTLREVPADADVISQKLMMRAGMIRKVAAGIYTYLPLGLRAIKKLEAIVRDEMNRAGDVELLLPSIERGVLCVDLGRGQCT